MPIATALSSLDRGDPTNQPSLLLRTLYPLPFTELVLDQARQRDIDPLLPYALMRQESQFVPDARSGADARGLTQIYLLDRPGYRRAARRLLLLCERPLSPLHQPSLRHLLSGLQHAPVRPQSSSPPSLPTMPAPAMPTAGCKAPPSSTYLFSERVDLFPKFLITSKSSTPTTASTSSSTEIETLGISRQTSGGSKHEPISVWVGVLSLSCHSERSEELL